MGKNKILIKEEGFFEDGGCKSRKIIYLLFLLLMTGLLLSTSSYAWFTTNRVVTLDTLNVKVQTEGSLEISVDGINWKASINQDEIISANATYPMSINQIPSLIDPVSTAGGLNDLGLLNMYLGKIISNSNGDYILTATFLSLSENGRTIIPATTTCITLPGMEPRGTIQLWYRITSAK